MTENRKQALRGKLDRCREATIDMIQQMDPEDWTHLVYSSHATDWTARDVLRHLVWAEGGMLRLMKNIRDGGSGAGEDFDQDAYNARGIAKLEDKMPADLMAMMHDNRKQVLAFMEELDDADWEKTGRHGSMGIMSIEQICEQIAIHEQEHLADLRQALELGPDR